MHVQENIPGELETSDERRNKVFQNRESKEEIIFLKAKGQVFVQAKININ